MVSPPLPCKNFCVHISVINNIPLKEHAKSRSTHCRHEPRSVFYAGNIDCCPSALPGSEFVLTVCRHVHSGRPTIRDLGRMFKKYEILTHLHPQMS